MSGQRRRMVAYWLLGYSLFIIHRRGRLHLHAAPAASSAPDTYLPREQREATPTA